MILHEFLSIEMKLHSMSQKVHLAGIEPATSWSKENRQTRFLALKRPIKAEFEFSPGTVCTIYHSNLIHLQ